MMNSLRNECCVPFSKGRKPQEIFNDGCGLHGRVVVEFFCEQLHGKVVPLSGGA